MRQESSMSVHTVVIDSNQRTRQNDTKIHYTCDVVHGPARLYLPTTKLSSNQQQKLEKPLCVDAAEMILDDRELAL